MRELLRILVIVALAAFAYTKYQDGAHRRELALQPASRISVPVPAKVQETNNFSCDGRTYCSQMTSCAEATYFIEHCPGTKMDGDNDGIPCETQWCQ